MIGALKECAAEIVREILPHKTFDQRVEEQNTRVVWYPRVHGLPKKYVYGKVPGEPLVKVKRHPEGVSTPSVRREQDQAVIGTHIAI